MGNMLQLYPRGFLGRAMVQQGVKPHPNPDVDSLYVQYINRSINTTDLRFRRKVLETALLAFGVNDFERWLLSQHQSSLVGETHYDFLEDTFQFITKGRRNISIGHWLPLLEVSDSAPCLHEHSEEAKEFFGISSNRETRYPRNRSMTEVIQRWCSQPGGLEDMLCTMHVLFGNTAPKTSIAIGVS